ncbi:MAG TPA: nitroreductase [Stellaceae bacterium]|nr:nitroreductase [Stellaceae bacterium]
MDTIETLVGRVSPAQLAEPGPTPAQLDKILEAAAAAPDHGRMKPWRFIVVEGEARGRLGEVMAQSLKRREPESPEGRLDAERRKALRSPTIVVVAATIKKNPNVPEVEQIVAAGAAAQNLLLAAHGMGLGGFWRTGAVAYDEEAKRAMGLGPDDRVVGIMYLGSVAMAGKPRETDLAAVVTRW